MPIDFFEKEVNKVRKRFNRTFGMLKVCDLKTRQSAILAICLLGSLKDKIINIRDKSQVEDDIRKFMMIRNVLNKVFAQMKNYLDERRGFANAGKYQNERSYVHQGKGGY